MPWTATFRDRNIRHGLSNRKTLTTTFANRWKTQASRPKLRWHRQSWASYRRCDRGVRKHRDRCWLTAGADFCGRITFGRCRLTRLASARILDARLRPTRHCDDSPYLLAFFTVCANISRSNNVTANAGLGLRNHPFPYIRAERFARFSGSALAGLYSGWARWFGAAGLATQPQANSRVAIKRGSLTGLPNTLILDS
jgi:hypothetical protein